MELGYEGNCRINRLLSSLDIEVYGQTLKDDKYYRYYILHLTNPAEADYLC
jgi:hypothetical protein